VGRREASHMCDEDARGIEVPVDLITGTSMGTVIGVYMLAILRGRIEYTAYQRASRLSWSQSIDSVNAS